MRATASLIAVAAAWMVACVQAPADTLRRSAPDPASASIRAARDPAPVLAPAQRDQLRRAFAAAEGGRWDEARTLAASNRLATRILLWMDLQREGRDFGAIASFLSTHPEWPSRDLLLRRAESALGTARIDEARVIAWFGNRAPSTGEGTLRLAEALERSGASARNAQMLRDAWRRLPPNEPVDTEILRRFSHHLRPEDHAARADRMLWDQRYADLPRALKLLDPETRLVADARFRLARRTGDALGALRNIPAHLAGEAGLMFEHARYLRRTGRDAEARAIQLSAPTPAGLPDRWWDEREWLIRKALRDGAFDDALRLVHGIGLTPGPQGQAHAEALFLEGWIALRRANDPARARHLFQLLHDGARQPVTRARGAYWAGRAAAAAGDLAIARHWFQTAASHPTTYYGQLASLQVVQPGASEISPALAPAPAAAELARIMGHELADAARLLIDIGQANRAKHFVRRLVEIAITPGEQRAAAQFALALDRPDLAVSVAKRAAQRSGLVMPDEGWPVIGTPPGNPPERALVLATIRQESAFEADAVSPAGARGLMQLMPATAQQVAAQLGVKADHTLARLTADPTYNMKLGKAYLAGLLADYDGSHLLALAAYNAGPGRAAQWIRLNGDPRDQNIDPVDWVEMIPFEETRNYVQRVMENFVVYRQRLGHADIAAPLARELVRPPRP